MAINQKEFDDNLNKAISWTNQLSKDFDYELGFYGTVFRQTHPVINGQSLYEDDRGYVIWNLDPYELSNYQEALNQVLKAREGTQSSNFHNSSELGRILSFETGCTTHDGIIIAETQCFFDESDVPPIDTWFYLESKSEVGKNNDVLYCWIPKPFEHLVEVAMKLTLFDCYAWYDYAWFN